MGGGLTIQCNKIYFNVYSGSPFYRFWSGDLGDTNDTVINLLNIASSINLSDPNNSMAYNGDMGAYPMRYLETPNIIAPDTVCVSDAIVFDNTSSGEATFLWDFGDGMTDTAASPVHSYNSPGTYFIRLIINTCSCKPVDTAYDTVVVKPTARLLVNDTILCRPGLVTLTAISSDIAHPTFIWTPDFAIVGSNTQRSVLADATKSTKFIVQMADSSTGACKASDTAQIAFVDFSQFTACCDTVICPGDSIELHANGGDYYVWSPVHDISSIYSKDVEVYPQDDAIYFVTVSDTIGCDTTLAVRVSLHQSNVSAGPDRVITSGESTILQGSGGVSYRWAPPKYLNRVDIANPSAAPPNTTQYIVTGTTAAGCEGDDTVNVFVANVFIPSAFSPNGDGLNDEFALVPRGAMAVTVLNLSIYNRWGQRVFVGWNAKDGWDGTFQGQKCEVGTYFYTCAYVVGSRQYNLKGDVLLVR